MSQKLEQTKVSMAGTLVCLRACTSFLQYFKISPLLTALRYRFNVLADGTWENRKTFAYIDSGVPDGSPAISFFLILPHLIVSKTNTVIN